MNETLVDFDALWNYDDPASTELKFRDILNNSDVKDNGYKAELLTQIARTLGLQMKFDDAHKTLDEALNLIKGENVKAHVRYLLEKGRTFNTSKHQDKARPLFFDAYKFALKNNLDYYAIDAAHMLGIVDKGEDSLKWNEIGIQLAELSKDEKANKWLGSLYNNTAWTFHDMGNYDKALELFEKNVKWHEEKKSKKQLIIAKWSVARTLRSMNRIDEALRMQFGLIDELKEKGLEQDGYIFEEIGECLLLLKREHESKIYFKNAFELLSKDIWIRENERVRLERLNKLSK